MSSRTTYLLPWRTLDRVRIEAAVLEAACMLPGVVVEVAEYAPNYVVAYFLVTVTVGKECDFLGDFDRQLEQDGVAANALPAEIGFVAMSEEPGYEVPPVCELFIDSTHSANRYLFGAASRLCERVAHLLNAQLEAD